MSTCVNADFPNGIKYYSAYHGFWNKGNISVVSLKLLVSLLYFHSLICISASTSPYLPDFPSYQRLSGTKGLCWGVGAQPHWWWTFTVAALSRAAPVTVRARGSSAPVLGHIVLSAVPLISCFSHFKLGFAVWVIPILTSRATWYPPISPEKVFSDASKWATLWSRCGG